MAEQDGARFVADSGLSVSSGCESDDVCFVAAGGSRRSSSVSASESCAWVVAGADPDGEERVLLLPYLR